ncbi:Ferredoxin-NADP reductase [Streptomyces sp. DvalAA-14]|uniref:MOSC and FAD-binding oxidoreductase domain-containing protein n=1 Tax=unclassified Streptomyces TaxID=2593676 RepID=UPI00081B12E4|nr:MULTISPECIES: MOSC and FAD-binding oxidoreductase domain-containing protein [unclassified Streptomyces]MYS20688.1 MOSC domain-containing protein [Streptomyces sp. SID4948]SCD74785.1 Ferredoxin-NADP reductase [Streptomyces sp. DvalAA-14]
MATLTAVNVGMPKNVPWNGKTVYTGAWKRTVSGPQMVRRLNIDGDGQGDLNGHGGEQRAVLVYQTDSYRYWAKELGRQDLEPGHFGENFTVDGLPDDEVCIGDRYRIGGAVFEVTQPRVTCYRVGLRLGEPQMAALLISHRRPGFYLRVIEEGHVEAGQEIVKVASGPESMSVQEIDAVLYLPGHTRDQIERALRIPALSPGWQSSLRTLLEHDDSGSGAGTGSAGLTGEAGGAPPAWTGFRPLTVARIEPESRSVFSLTLTSPDDAPLPAPQPGQFLTVKLQPDKGAPPLIRSYSLSGEPGTGSYRISVKQEPHGAASGHLRTRVGVGDALDIAAPRGSFCLGDADTPVVLLSVGVGATPVLAMLHALAHARSERRVWWLHGARDGAEHPFAEESRALVRSLPNAQADIYYSRPAGGDRQGVDYTGAGHLSPDKVAALRLPADADAYLCGPPDFMKDLTAALVDSGLDASRIHTELFGAGPSTTPGIAPQAARPPHRPPGPEGTGPAVSFARSGVTVPWNDDQQSLLELAEACDVPVRWSCRTGVCHTCESGLLSGSVAYSPDPVEPPAEGNALICCSKPAEEVVLDL